MNYKIILASSSPRRKELLETVGIKFEIVSPTAEETMAGNEEPENFALRVSVDKASSVSKRLDEGCVVIGADTVVVVDGGILGKPSDEEEAAFMLNTISGREHSVLTAFSILRPPDQILHSEIVATRVRVKPLAAHEIEGYIKTGEPMDKAGAYGIQGIGSFMVKEIEGSYTNVVGLPLAELLQAFRNLGIFELFSADGC